MSASPPPLKKYKQPLAVENQEFAVLGFMTFPIDVLLLIARYMNYDDFEHLAVTCQAANAAFRKLLTHSKFKENVLPAPQFRIDDRRSDPSILKIRPPIDLSRRESRLMEAMMTNDGKWLFVLRVRADNVAHYILDVYQQRCLSPLKFDHFHQARFDTTSPIAGYYQLRFIGIDNTDDNPGLYFMDVDPAGWVGGTPDQIQYQATRQIFSWHLKDPKVPTLKKIGDRLPYSYLAVEHRTSDLQVYGMEGANCLRRLTLSHTGQRLPEPQAIELDLVNGDYRIKLSPNGRTLLLHEINGNHVRILNRHFKCSQSMRCRYR